LECYQLGHLQHSWVTPFIFSEFTPIKKKIVTIFPTHGWTKGFLLNENFYFKIEKLNMATMKWVVVSNLQTGYDQGVLAVPGSIV